MVRIDGKRVSALDMWFWKSARQVELTSIRLLASMCLVGSLRVSGAGLRPLTNGLRSPMELRFAKLEARTAQHQAMQLSACD